MRFDLHVHTTASDGTLTPSALVRRAAERGLAAVAITDHDSVEGIPEALRAVASLTEHPIAVIPGVELSAVHRSRDIHLLGYFVHHTDPSLSAHLEDLRSARRHRAETIVAALTAAGYAITLDEVLELSAGGAVGRSHVARALVDRGHAEDVTDAFSRLLGRGKPFYVAKDVRTPLEVLRIVREAGGVPVLAHPGITRADDLIPELIDAGLAGIEAFHAEHTPEQRERYQALARRHGLIATGGTDYHGPLAPNPPLGSTDVPVEALTSLFEAAGRPLPPHIVDALPADGPAT